MLPAPYYYLHYDADTGEILAFWNPLSGDCEFSPTIIVSLEQHEAVLKATYDYRVRDNKLVNIKEPESEEVVQEQPKPVQDMSRSLIAGLVIDEVCYAIKADALSVMMLGLSSGSDRIKAVTHTKDGNRIVELSRSEAENVASKIAEHLSDLFSG